MHNCGKKTYFCTAPAKNIAKVSKYACVVSLMNFEGIAGIFIRENFKIALVRKLKENCTN